MKTDLLRIEFRNIGGMFTDGPSERKVHEVWGCFLCHAEKKDPQFVLAVGTKDEMFDSCIARLEGILARLKEAKNHELKS